MPRPRQSATHLPPRVYAHGAGYRYVRPDGTKVALGRDLGEALKRYAAIIQESSFTGGTGDTVAWLLDWYIANIRIVAPRNSPRTITEKTAMLPHLKDAIGHIPLRLLRPMHVRGYLDLGVQNSRAVRANREKALLSHACTIAVGKGWIDSNPCTGVTRNFEAPRKRAIADEEWAAIRPHLSVPMQCLADLVYRTLQRPGDIIRWTEKQNLITVNGKPIIRNIQSKTGATVDIARTPELDAIFARLKAHRDQATARRNARQQRSAHVIDILDATLPLIRAKGNRGFTESGIKANWNHAAKAAGATNFGLYDLKGKGATDMYQDGVPIAIISLLCGHESVTTTETYINQRLRRVVEPNRRQVG